MKQPLLARVILGTMILSSPRFVVLRVWRPSRGADLEGRGLPSSVGVTDATGGISFALPRDP